MYKDNLVDAWIKAEENLGLKNSLFFWENGKTTQWVDSEEAEEFFEKVKKMNFDEIFDKFFKAIEDKDKVKMFECLAVFNEIDEHREIVGEDVFRRLMKVRKETHEEIYK